MAKLILIGIPIGNPDDISIRSLNYLKEAKHLVAENPEGLDKLFETYGLEKNNKNIMYAHTWPKVLGDTALVPDVMKILESGENVYMVSDAGMPGIADPGGGIISACIRNNISIESTPGPSAVIAGATVTGCHDSFTFVGFMPKGDRVLNYILKRFKDNFAPCIFMLINWTDGKMEDGHVCQSLNALIENWGDRSGALCYNLTTHKEHVVFGKFSELKEYYTNHYILDDEVMLVADGLSQSLTMRRYMPKP